MKRGLLDFIVPRLQAIALEDALTWTYCVAVAACAGWLLLRWLAVNREFGFSRRRRTEPRCARCGYIVGRGCPVVCAECGSDVREGGIVTPTTPPSSGAAPAAGYVLAALAPLPVALFLGSVVARWQPFGWDYQALWVSEAQTGSPGSAGDRSHRFMILVHGSGRRFRRRPAALSLRDQAIVGGVPQWGRTDQWFTPPDWTYVERDANGTPFRLARFDRHAAEAWVARAAREAPPAEKMRVASEIEAHFAAAARGDLPPPAGGPRPGLPGLGRPGATVRYDIRPAPIHVMRVVCYVPMACAAVWAARWIRTRRLRRRRAGWLRAAEQLGLSAERMHIEPSNGNVPSPIEGLTRPDGDRPRPAGTVNINGPPW